MTLLEKQTFCIVPRKYKNSNPKSKAATSWVTCADLQEMCLLNTNRHVLIMPSSTTLQTALEATPTDLIIRCGDYRNKTSCANE